MADTVANAKRRRGTVRPYLTRMENDTGKLEEKDGLIPSDERKIKRLKELAKDHDSQFEQRHEEVLNFIKAEDKAALDSEEAVLDEHVDRVTEIIERLKNLRTWQGLPSL